MKSFKEISWLRPEIIFMALFSIFIHLIIANNLEYHRDDLLYFSLGMHPAAGYVSVPPLTGWIAWLMQRYFWLFGFCCEIIPGICLAVRLYFWLLHWQESLAVQVMPLFFQHSDCLSQYSLCGLIHSFNLSALRYFSGHFPFT